MKKVFLTTTLSFCTSLFLLAQNVGIGTSTPNYKLDVVGSVNTSGNLYVSGSVGIGTTNPLYKLQVNDGAIAIYNTTDLKTWYISYSSTNNYFQINESGTARLVVQNGGNVGIGTPAPAYKLDVAGSIRATSNFITEGNATIDGTLTVNNGKGVAYNASSATNLKVYPFTTGTFFAGLGGQALSSETSIIFGGGFTSTPKVFVGDIDVTSGTSGELYRVQLILYGCTTTSCKARLLNTSPNPVNYSITWNCVAIGN